MLTMVLGAPGSGKTSLIPTLRGLLREHVVLDWDEFMSPASKLAGSEIWSDPARWDAYQDLVRSVVNVIVPRPMVVLGVCTLDQLEGWPIDQWILLDCSDDERQRRLFGRGESVDLVGEAIEDAKEYRRLSIPIIDSTARPVDEVAELLAAAVREA